MAIKELVKKNILKIIDTLLKEPFNIAYTAFLMWGFIPLIIIAIFAGYKAINGIFDDILIIKIYSAVIPFWFNLIITPTLKNILLVLGQYIFFFLLTLILVHYKIWKPSKPNWL